MTSKFKIGDKVLVQDFGPGIIRRDFQNGNYRVSVPATPGIEDVDVNECYIEKNEPKFQTGDRVRVSNTMCNHAGKNGVVTSVDARPGDNLYKVHIDEEEARWYGEDSLEKEPKPKFKNGDLVFLDFRTGSGKRRCVVLDTSWSGKYRLRRCDQNKIYYQVDEEYLTSVKETFRKKGDLVYVTGLPACSELYELEREGPPAGKWIPGVVVDVDEDDKKRPYRCEYSIHHKGLGGEVTENGWFREHQVKTRIEKETPMTEQKKELKFKLGDEVEIRSNGVIKEIDPSAKYPYRVNSYWFGEEHIFQKTGEQEEEPKLKMNDPEIIVEPPTQPELEPEESVDEKFPTYRVGDPVLHCNHGYKGVVTGLQNPSKSSNGQFLYEVTWLNGQGGAYLETDLKERKHSLWNRIIAKTDLLYGFDRRRRNLNLRQLSLMDVGEKASIAVPQPEFEVGDWVHQQGWEQGAGIGRVAGVNPQLIRPYYVWWEEKQQFSWERPEALEYIKVPFRMRFQWGPFPKCDDPNTRHVTKLLIRKYMNKRSKPSMSNYDSEKEEYEHRNGINTLRRRLRTRPIRTSAAIAGFIASLPFRPVRWLWRWKKIIVVGTVLYSLGYYVRPVAPHKVGSLTVDAVESVGTWIAETAIGAYTSLHETLKQNQDDREDLMRRLEELERKLEEPDA